jgi:hypothetical protein
MTYNSGLIFEDIGIELNQWGRQAFASLAIWRSEVGLFADSPILLKIRDGFEAC